MRECLISLECRDQLNGIGNTICICKYQVKTVLNAEHISMKERKNDKKRGHRTQITIITVITFIGNRGIIGQDRFFNYTCINFL